MNRRKPNISHWYPLALAALLTLGCVIGATGVSLARYRAERDAFIEFQAAPIEEFYLGTVTYTEEDTTGTFTPGIEGGWELVDSQTQLGFAVANGTSTEAFAQEDQSIRIRLVASLGFWTGEETDPVMIRLLVPVEKEETTDETEPTETTAATETTEEVEEVVLYDTYIATAIRIKPGSPMYDTFGDGWVFTFLDEEWEEVRFTLEGGELNWLDMKLILNGSAITDASLLQLQISS